MSYLINIIRSHPNTWEEYMSAGYPKIIIGKTERDPNLRIFNYGIGADFNDPVIQESRGIIIDTSIPKVVCFPFRKFGEYAENYVDTIDWSTAVAQEKIDGSIIKLWYNEKTKEWVFSTNRCIYAEDTPNYRSDIYLTVMDVIKSATNYPEIETAIKCKCLDKELTYIFELVSPEFEVVIHYDVPYLYHIGTRRNCDGTEINADIEVGFTKIGKPQVFPEIRSLDYAIFSADEINESSDNKIHECLLEGFVIVDKDFHRIKVKSTVYTMMHNLINNGDLSEEKLIKLIIENKIAVADFCINYPKYAPIVSHYFNEYVKLRYYTEKALTLCRKLYRKYNISKKELVSIISDCPIAAFVFNGLDNEKTFDEILETFHSKENAILHRIKPYQNDESYSVMITNLKNLYIEQFTKGTENDKV